MISAQVTLIAGVSTGLLERSARLPPFDHIVRPEEGLHDVLPAHEQFDAVQRVAHLPVPDAALHLRKFVKTI